MISSKRTDWLITLLLLTGLFCLYISILPDHLVTINEAGDGGDFLAAILTQGIPHPTGYPTYMILGGLFLQIPWSTPYFRVALLSAFSAACAAGLLFLWVANEVVKDRKEGMWAGLVAALAWGTAPLVFSQAVIVEAYSLQALFWMLNLWWVTLLTRSSEKLKDRILACLLAFTVGLSLGNHVTILFLAPFWAYALYTAYKSGETWRFIIIQVGLMMAGGLVYLYLPLSACHFPPVNWGNPQTWSGFWWEISGDAYRGLLFKFPINEMVSRIGALARMILDQFNVVGLLLGVLGASLNGDMQRHNRFLLYWGFTTYTVFSLGYNTGDSFLYLIPAFLVFSIWFGIGAATLIRLRWRSLWVGSAVGVLLLVILVVRIPATLSSIDPRQDMKAVSFAEKYLNTAPENAILLTDGDEDTFPLWYYHFGLGWRPDVRIVLLPLTQFVWYQETLHHTYPDLTLPPYLESPYSTWGETIPSLNPERQVCRSQPDQNAPFGISVQCPWQAP